MSGKHFLEALDRLGANDAERAKVLGVSTRTITRWRRGDLPAAVQAVVRPELLAGLLLDVAGPAQALALILGQVKPPRRQRRAPWRHMRRQA